MKISTPFFLYSLEITAIGISYKNITFSLIFKMLDKKGIPTQWSE